MTLTLPILLDARAIFLLFLGEAKRRVFEAALAEGPIESIPVAAVLRQRRVPTDVFWSASSC
jgi:6-phosphogluconolactonase